MIKGGTLVGWNRLGCLVIIRMIGLWVGRIVVLRDAEELERGQGVEGILGCNACTVSRQPLL